MNTGTPEWLLLLLKRNLNAVYHYCVYSLGRELTEVWCNFFVSVLFFEVVIGGSNVDFIATAEKIIVSVVFFYLCMLVLRTFRASISYLQETIKGTERASPIYTLFYR